MSSWFLVLIWVFLGFALLAIAFSRAWGTLGGVDSVLDPPRDSLAARAKASPPANKETRTSTGPDETNDASPGKDVAAAADDSISQADSSAAPAQETSRSKNRRAASIIDHTPASTCNGEDAISDNRDHSGCSDTVRNVHDRGARKR